MTMNGNNYSDFYIARLNENNLSTVSGIEDVGSMHFQVYPNPTNHTLNIYSSEPSGDLYVRDITGKQVGAYPVVSTNTMIDISSYSNGMYYATYIHGASYSTVKVIKQ